MATRPLQPHHLDRRNLRRRPQARGPQRQLRFLLLDTPFWWAGQDQIPSFLRASF